MKTRREINKYSILEFTKIEKHLEEMAAKGWMLSKTGGFFWTYEEAEPKQMHFSIMFFPKTNNLDPEPSENLKMMWDFCERTGWKLVSQLGQMQIFCNEEENPVPIETEAWIQVKNIHQTAKINVVFLFGILLVNAILQLAIQVMQFAINPINWLGASYNIWLVLVWLAFGIGCGVELIHYFLWYRKAKRIAEEEDYLYLPKSIGGFRVVYLGVAIISLVFSFLSLLDFVGANVVAVGLFWVLVMIFVPYASSRFLKWKKVSAKANIAITVVLAIVCSFVMVGCIVISVMKNAESIFERNTEMPLQISDIKDVSHDSFEESFRVSNSVFISYVEGMQHEDWDEEEVEGYLSIDYEIIVIKVPFVYDLCKEELLSKYSFIDEDETGFEGYCKDNIPQWEAEEVYRRYTGGTARNGFIVCYEDRIVQIDFNWDVTDEEIEKVCEILDEIE